MAQIVDLIVNVSYTFNDGAEGGVFSSAADYDINTSTIIVSNKMLPLSPIYETTGYSLDLGGTEYCLKIKDGCSSLVLIFSSHEDEVAVLEYVFNEEDEDEKDGEIFVMIDVQPDDLLRLRKDAFYDMIDEEVVKQFPHISSSSVTDAKLSYDSIPGENGHSKTVIKAELLDFVFEID